MTNNSITKIATELSIVENKSGNKRLKNVSANSQSRAIANELKTVAFTANQWIDSSADTIAEKSNNFNYRIVARLCGRGEYRKLLGKRLATLKKEMMSLKKEFGKTITDSDIRNAVTTEILSFFEEHETDDTVLQLVDAVREAERQALEQIEA